MPTVRLALEYDGTGFSGWAAQPGLRTVEGEVRAALDRVYPRWDGLAVAGRTDAGVHALGQVASFEADGGPPPERAAHALNGVLPDDVAVVASEEAPEGFNARFSATGRSYRYRVWRREAHSPLELRRSLWWPRPVDEAGLEASAALLVGEHDFKAFTPTETQHDSFVRIVREVSLVAGRARPVVHGHRGQLPAPHGAHAGRDDAGAGPRGDGAPARRAARATRRERPRRPGASI